MAPDSAEAAIYAAWFVELARMPEDELGDVPRGTTRGRFLIDALRARLGVVRRSPHARGRDVRGFPGSDASPARSSSSAAGSAPIRPAGAGSVCIARFFLTMSFTRCPVLRRFFDLAIGQGGDGATVNVGGFAQDGSFEMGDGPGYRQVVDLAGPVRGRYVITTGQSGNVFSRRYRDLLPEWRAGRYFEIEGQPAADVLDVQGPLG